MDKLFVYGTLRRGFSLHDHLNPQAAEFMGKAWTQGRLYDLGDYPGAFPSDSPGDKIEGELYKLAEPEAQLRELDEIEEFDTQHPDQSLFVRRLAEVHLNPGQTVRAWVYFLPKKPAEARLIPGGDYLESRRSRV